MRRTGKLSCSLRFRCFWHLAPPPGRRKQGRQRLPRLVKADGDENSGRKHEGIHNGVDYTFTLIDGDPQHASTRLDVFEADGSTRRGTCNIVIREATLYLAAEMALQQQDGRSVFE